MARGLLSLGTMTGILLVITGAALLVTFIVITVRQHNDLASVSETKRVLDADLQIRRMSAGPEKLAVQPVLEIRAGKNGQIIGKAGSSKAHAALKMQPVTKSSPSSPIETTAQCNGPDAPNCTRWDIWSRCFIPLVDLHPKDGFITKAEVAAFMDKHLRVYEKWLAPSPETIVRDCDKKRGGNGRVNWAIFKDSTVPGCLGTTRDICYTKGACDRELEKLGLLPVVSLPTTTTKPSAKQSNIAGAVGGRNDKYKARV